MSHFSDLSDIILNMF